MHGPDQVVQLVLADAVPPVEPLAAVVVVIARVVVVAAGGLGVGTVVTFFLPVRGMVRHAE